MPSPGGLSTANIYFLDLCDETLPVTDWFNSVPSTRELSSLLSQGKGGNYTECHNCDDLLPYFVLFVFLMLA